MFTPRTVAFRVLKSPEAGEHPTNEERVDEPVHSYHFLLAFVGFGSELDQLVGETFWFDHFTQVVEYGPSSLVCIYLWQTFFFI